MIRGRARMRTVSVVAGSLNFIRTGSGEPLLLVHPLGGELVVWEPVMDRLAAERDVIAVDMPGFGASPPLPGGVEPTPQALAAALAAQLDALDVERAHVAGNSLGGWVALELAKLGRARSVTGALRRGLLVAAAGPAALAHPHGRPCGAAARAAAVAQRARTRAAARLARSAIPSGCPRPRPPASRAHT